MVKNGPSASTSAALSSAFGGPHHQQVLVLLAGLGVDGVMAGRALQHEAARLGLLPDQVRRSVTPRRTELDLRQGPADRVDVGDLGPAAHVSTSPPVRRSPRAQSAAGIGRLPTACTSPSRSAPAPVPTTTAFLPAISSPGGSEPSAGVIGPSFSRSPA